MREIQLAEWLNFVLQLKTLNTEKNPISASWQQFVSLIAHDPKCHSIFFVINTKIIAFHMVTCKEQKLFVIGAQNIFPPKYIAWGTRNFDLPCFKVISKNDSK